MSPLMMRIKLCYCYALCLRVTLISKKLYCLEETPFLLMKCRLLWIQRTWMKERKRSHLQVVKGWQQEARPSRKIVNLTRRSKNQKTRRMVKETSSKSDVITVKRRAIQGKFVLKGKKMVAVTIGRTQEMLQLFKMMAMNLQRHWWCLKRIQKLNG